VQKGDQHYEETETSECATIYGSSMYRRKICHNHGIYAKVRLLTYGSGSSVTPYRVCYIMLQEIADEYSVLSYFYTVLMIRGSLFKILHNTNQPLDKKRRLRMALDVVRL
jgi:hypothetical protein